MKPSRTIPFAIVCGGIIIAIAVYVSLPNTPASNQPVGDASLVRPVGATDHILGNPLAKVMIVEYSDFDCDFCRGFNDSLHQIIANEGAQGEVAWVYREFPLTEIHPNALNHAEAAECAALVGGNDAFWKFEDLLFAHQPVDPSQYGTLAQTINIPGDAFASCYASAASKVDARITADRQNALDMGATGTPYSLILVQGQAPVVMNGGYSYDALKQLVDQALSTASAN